MIRKEKEICQRQILPDAMAILYLQRRANSSGAPIVMLDPSWFTEVCKECGSAFSMKLKEKLYEEQTPYQLIEIYETETFGTLMTLDGLVMLTDRDNFIYHEMMTHPGLFVHPEPKRVLIIGGGDCGSLREVLRHNGVARVDQVELDERVTRVSEQFFPELCAANHDARAHFHFTDGIQWVAEAEPASYDAVIVDSTDPVGPAAGLFSDAFYKSCFRALGPRGVLVGQSESPLFHLKLIKAMRGAMRGAGFHEVNTLCFPQCSYPSGWWSATLACKNLRVADLRQQDVARMDFPTRYYNLDTHRGALAAPEYLRQAFA